MRINCHLLRVVKARVVTRGPSDGPRLLSLIESALGTDGSKCQHRQQFERYFLQVTYSGRRKHGMYRPVLAVLRMPPSRHAMGTSPSPTSGCHCNIRTDFLWGEMRPTLTATQQLGPWNPRPLGVCPEWPVPEDGTQVLKQSILAASRCNLVEPGHQLIL